MDTFFCFLTIAGSFYNAPLNFLNHLSFFLELDLLVFQAFDFFESLKLILYDLIPESQALMNNYS